MSKITEIQAMVDFDLRDYQIEILNNLEEHKYSAFYLGRRMGKSTIIALDALYRALTTNNTTIIVACVNERTTTFMQDKIVEYARSYLTRNQQRILSFHNGSRILFGSMARGTTHFIGSSADHVYVDEADYVRPGVMYETIMPITSTNYGCGLTLISTVSSLPDTIFKEWMTDRTNQDVYTNTFNHINTEYSEHVENSESEWEYLGYSYLKEDVKFKWQGKTHEA